MTTTACYRFETSMGTCAIAWRGAGSEVTELALPGGAAPGQWEECLAGAARPPPAMVALSRRIAAHLDGEPQDFGDVAVALAGAGDFALRVYGAIRAIPAGAVRSYGEVAARVGQPGAARAVGQALGRNPIPLLIPCHRVIGAGGEPCGFSAPGGVATKWRLLAREGYAPALPASLRSPRCREDARVWLERAEPELAAGLALAERYADAEAEPPYSALFRAIVQQQLTPRAAAGILGRVQALFRHGAIPQPEEVLETSDSRLRQAGLSAAKAAALRDLADKTLDGTVPGCRLIAALDDDELVRRLVCIRGVGRWTVEMLLIFNLGRRDVFPPDDLALRKGLADHLRLPSLPHAREAAALAERWRPYRTVAALALWRIRQPAATVSDF